MPEPNRIVIDRVDWKSVLPVLRLASAFKHALQPGKLLVAFVAVLAIHFSGVVLDTLWGTPEDGPAGVESMGIYESLLMAFGQELQQLFRSVLDLELGIGSVSNGVFGSLHGIFIQIPTWMVGEHPWYALVFGIDLLLILAIASGILNRMAASQVCAGRLTTAGDAKAFVTKRAAWYLLTPLMPVMLIVVLGAVLALAGLVFFNAPGLDVVGSLAYGLLLILGFVIMAVGLLLLFALFLMPPALAVEGSDGFDAIARSFNYILFRPWQFGFYLFSAILYLAVVYILVGTLATLTMDATHYCVELGSFVTVSEQHEDGASEVDHGHEAITRHEAALVGPEDYGATVSTSSWIIDRWFELMNAFVAAILLSTLCCLQTQVYVLLRRSADGTPLDQYDSDEPASVWDDTPSVADDSAGDEQAKAEG